MQNLNDDVAWSTADPSDTRPLAGIRVVDAGTYVAGPLGALVLADLGAQVIKIEAPSGDPCRHYGPGKGGLSALWVNTNRGKRSVALDLKSDSGKAAFFGLLANADIFIDNWRPRVEASLGISRSVLQDINAKLIRVTLTGYGASGPLADSPVFDSIIQGSTGVVSAPQTDARPNVTTFFIADKTAGMMCAQAALAALAKRSRTGRGCHVEVSMLDSLAYFNFPDLLTHRTFIGDCSEWKPPVSPVFQTADGLMILSPATARHITLVLEVIGKVEWIRSLREMHDKDRRVREFFEMIRPELLKRNTAEWMALFQAVDVPTGPVNTADSHIADPQVVHNEIYGVSDSPVGPIRTVRYPAIFDGQKVIADWGAPALRGPRDVSQ